MQNQNKLLSLLNSLRVRLAILVTSIAAIALTIAGIAMWHQIREDALIKFDWRILRLTTAALEQQSPPHDPQKLARDINSQLNQLTAPLSNSAATLLTPPDVLLSLMHYGIPVHQTPNWPKNISFQIFNNQFGNESSSPPPQESWNERNFNRPPPPPHGERNGIGIRPPNQLRDFPETKRYKGEKRPTFADFKQGSSHYRVLYMHFGPNKLILGVNYRILNLELAATKRIIYITMIGTLLLIIVGTFLMTRSMVSSINGLTNQIASVHANELTPIRVDQIDNEFIRLVHVFNEMISRLNRSFAQATRFSADAAHELKTPLTILQGEIEQAIHLTKNDSDEQRYNAKLLFEVANLKSIISKLLLLAKADSGNIPLDKQHFDLTELLKNQLEDVQLLSPQLNTTIQAPDTLSIFGDMTLLNQAFTNLVTNARKYNADLQNGGWIKLVVLQNEQQTIVHISNPVLNTLSQENLDNLFERFYRANQARTRSEEEVNSIGLGLAIAREIVRAHGGEITVALDKQIITFTTVLPRK